MSASVFRPASPDLVEVRAERRSPPPQPPTAAASFASHRIVCIWKMAATQYESRKCQNTTHQHPRLGILDPYHNLIDQKCNDQDFQNVRKTQFRKINAFYILFKKLRYSLRHSVTSPFFCTCCLPVLLLYIFYLLSLFRFNSFSRLCVRSRCSVSASDNCLFCGDGFLLTTAFFGFGCCLSTVFLGLACLRSCPACYFLACLTGSCAA